MYLKLFKSLFLIICLVSYPAAAFITVSTQPVNFGTRSSTEGYVSWPGHIQIDFNDEDFDTWLEIYTDNAGIHEISGLNDRNQNPAGQYGGIIATDTITSDNFSRIMLDWNLNSSLPPREDPDWKDIKDKGDDDWEQHIGKPSTSMRLSESVLEGKSARIYIRGFFGDDGNRMEPGSYAGRINLDFWNEEPKPEVALVAEEAAENVGRNGGKIDLPGGSYISIPPGALEEETHITIQKLNTEHPEISSLGPPRRAASKEAETIYRFLPEGLKFKRPVEIRLFFSHPSYSGSSYKIFRRDQFFSEWEFIGGRTGGAGAQLYVSASIDSFSIYSVYSVENLKASDFRPRNRIITPSDPTVNTDAKFRGLGAQNTEVRIFDVAGRQVRTLKRAPYIWDARDENGRKVESGIYIYQFEADIEGEKELVSGVIAVAK